MGRILTKALFELGLVDGDALQRSVSDGDRFAIYLDEVAEYARSGINKAVYRWLQKTDRIDLADDELWQSAIKTFGALCKQGVKGGEPLRSKSKIGTGHRTVASRSGGARDRKRIEGMTIDRADWHIDSMMEILKQSGEVLDAGAEAAHIGFFLHWIITRDHMGEDLGELIDRDDRVAIHEGRLTGRQILMERCDGKFAECDVADEVLPFVNQYYMVEGGYPNDICSFLHETLPSVYHAEDSLENAEGVAAIVDRRYQEWKRCSH